MKEFKENDLVVFIGKGRNNNGEQYIYRIEVGKFKRYNKDKTTAFVYYHSGDTTSVTNVEDLELIDNYRNLITNLGNGDVWE